MKKFSLTFEDEVMNEIFNRNIDKLLTWSDKPLHDIAITF